MQHLVRRHEGEVVVVIGTGPSTWTLGQRPEIKTVLLKTINIGVNRGFDAGHPVLYQVSLDQIWTALIRKPAAASSFKSLNRLYTMWCSKWNHKDLAFLDWVYVFKDKLSIHPEVWRYFRLISPNAPFVRLAPRRNAEKAPYDCLGFQALSGEPQWGRYNGLLTGGNSAPTAIHLGAVMGAKRIFLLGVDMTTPDPSSRQWETGPVYYRPNVKKSFERLARGLGRDVKIINLNHQAMLMEFQKADSDDHAVELLNAATGA